MTVDVKNLIERGKTQRGAPVMSTLLERIGEEVDVLEEKINLLRGLDKTGKTEFLTMYRGFFPKDQIGKCLGTTTLRSKPVADKVIGDYDGFDEEYEVNFDIVVDLHEPWDKVVDRSFKNPYGFFSEPESDEIVEQINHGLVWVDFQYGETNSRGFFLMTGAGLIALAESNPDLYRGLTTRTNGELHWESYGKTLYPITEEVEWDCNEHDKEPEIKKLTNFYYWNYISNEGGIEFIPQKIYEENIPSQYWKEVKWRQRTQYTLTDKYRSHSEPFEIMLAGITADYLL